jgi:hypothetical protein
MKHIFERVVLLLALITQFATANQLFDAELISESPCTATRAALKFGHAQKLVMIYMAADNDLRSFGIRNLRQLLNIGSREPNIHIVVHLDIRDSQGTKITRRYYILNDDYVVLNEHDPKTQRMDSGDPNTLISFVTYAVDTFSADDYVLIFWDHGTGYLDPVQHSRTNITDLFTFNPTTHKLELDRSTQSAYTWNEDERGVCWDQTTKNYLTAQKLDYALNRCVTYIGKPFDIIAFDACLMSMIEIAELVSPYALFMVSSEEAILGTGYNYEMVFGPLREKPFETVPLAQHMVTMFDEAYSRITQDYELSAFDLSFIASITTNIDIVASLLQEMLRTQKKDTVKRALKVARSNTVHFNEPVYFDLYDLYRNILLQLNNFKTTALRTQKNALETALKEGMHLIEQCIIAHCAGTKLQNTRGISIYFPERMHSSYPNSPFAQSYQWYNFLRSYLSA